VRLRHSRIHAADCEACETTVGLLDHIDYVVELTGAVTTSNIRDLPEIANKRPVHRTLTSEIYIETDSDIVRAARTVGHLTAKAFFSSTARSQFPNVAAAS
jgi:hypothetical protein